MLFQGAPLLMLLLSNQTEEIAKATLSWSTNSTVSVAIQGHKEINAFLPKAV